MRRYVRMIFMVRGYSTLGKYLKEKREQAGLTQAEVGRSLGYASAHQYVSNWERNLCPPPLDKLYQLVKMYNIPPSEIIQVFLADQERYLRKILREKAI